MPIIQLNKSFTDDYANTNTFYRANNGDRGVFTFVISENIYFTSSNNEPITCSSVLKAQNKLRFPNRNSLLGFEVGQNVVLTKTAPNGATTTATVTIVSIDYSDLTIKFSSLLTPSSANLGFYDDNTSMTVHSTDMREELTLSLGFGLGYMTNFQDRVVNANLLSSMNVFRSSLIDNTFVQLKFDTSAMIVTDVESLVQLNPKSGHFDVTATIERLTDIDSYTRKWEVVITLIQLGGMMPFEFSAADNNYLKLYYDLGWKNPTNPINETITQWLDFSGTGSYDVPYLNDEYNSEVTTAPTNELTYDTAITNTITITSASSTIGLGAIYVPQDGNLFKNNQYSASKNCMMLNSFGALAIGTYTSEVFPLSGAFYEIEITALTYVANVHTITYIFRFGNQAFIDFMDGRSATDRNFDVWFKVGNINHLVHSNNLEKAPKTIADLSTLLFSPATFKLDKISDTYLAANGLICSIEDNVYLEQIFQVPKSKKYINGLFQIIVAEVGNLDNFFDLEKYNFDLSNIQTLADGTMELFTLKQPTSLNLGNNATNFNNAFISRKGGAPDTLTHFGLYFRHPFLINWKYWLSQTNAFPIFEDDRNQNWLNYQDGTYQLYVKHTLETETEIYTNYAEIKEIYDYDEAHTDTGQEWNGSTSIKYFKQSDGVQVNALILGEIMRVEVTVNNIYTATLDTIWAQMTIEPFEGSPRWNISTNYVADTNENNPFSPLSGQTRLKKTLVSGTQQTFEALIDTNKLTGANHKITLKYYNDVSPVEQNRSEFDVILTDKSNLSPVIVDECVECDDIFTVFANDTSINPTPDVDFKYDLTAMWYLLSGGDSVRFKVDKDDVNILDVAGFTFNSQSNAKYYQVDWASIINGNGAGLYKLYIEYTPVVGAVQELLWGWYNLVQYSREVAEGYVNIKSHFNTNQSVQGINFSKVIVIDSLNVKGFFGNRDPKTEIDNNIYNTRLQTKIVRENLNEYTLTTNPVPKIYTRKLLDLHLLSENDCYITDYNSHNQENYVNKRVIVSAVESPEYFQFTKYTKIIAKFEDKIKNSRSFH